MTTEIVGDHDWIIKLCKENSYADLIPRMYDALLSINMDADDIRFTMSTKIVNYKYSALVTLNTESMLKSLLEDRATVFKIYIDWLLSILVFMLQ